MIFCKRICCPGMHLLLCVLCSLAFFACKQQSGTSRKSTQQVPTSVSVKIVYPPAIKELVVEISETLKASPLSLGNGAAIVAEFIEMPGLLASDQIASGKTKVDAWITQSTLADLTNSSIRNLGAPQKDCTPLFATPLVIASARSTKDALKLSSAELPSKVLLDLNAKNSFLGTTPFYWANPEVSSLGLQALAQIDGLAKETPAIKELIFSNSAGYNQQAALLLEKLNDPPANVHPFVVTTEQAVAYRNATQPNDSKIFALYPAEGSIWHDFNICRSEVEWVNAAKQAAIRQVTEFLRKQEVAALTSKYGFRPAVETPQEQSILQSEYGVDPQFPKINLSSPSLTEVVSLKERWPSLERPLSVVFVFDTSGSIEEEGIGALVAAAQRVLSRLSAQDLVSIISVSNDITTVLKPTKDREKVQEALNTLESFGGTALYDGMLRAMQLVSRETPEHYRSVIFAVSDGPDKNSKANPEIARQTLRQAMLNRTVSFYVVTLQDDNADFTQLDAFAKGIFAYSVPSTLEELPKTLEQLWFDL